MVESGLMGENVRVGGGGESIDGELHQWTEC